MSDMTRITAKEILIHKINKINVKNKRFVKEILQDINQYCLYPAIGTAVTV